MMSGNRDVHTCKDKTEVNPFRSKIVKLLLKFFWLKVKRSIVDFERHTETLYLLFICFMRFLSASLTELIAFVCEKTLHCWKRKPFQRGFHLCLQVSAATWPSKGDSYQSLVFVSLQEKQALLWAITWRQSLSWNHKAETCKSKNFGGKCLAEL